MNTRQALLVTLGALAGCATNTDVPGPESAPTGTNHATRNAAVRLDPEELAATAVLTAPASPAGVGSGPVERVDANLARLRALRVFEVGELIVERPREAFNCYGPCPGSEAAVARARAEAAARLERFAAVAERAAGTPAPTACAAPTIDANLAALRALRVVTVQGLVVEQPRNNPRCYNLPCEEDREAAARITCSRAGQLAAIVAAADEAR